MPWHICRTHGRDSRAAFYLSRAGIRNFRPVEHFYFIDKRTKVEKFRVRERFRGYVFVEILSHAERDAASRAIGVAGLLGWWTEGGYKLATVPDHYVTDLIDAGPVILNKKNTKGRFKHGQKVKAALGAITEVIGEYQGLDDRGLNVVSAVMFGAVRELALHDDRLEAAE